MSYIKGLAHIGIYVNDMSNSIGFYNKLGFTLDREENPGIKLAFLSAGTCLIELIEKPHERTAGIVDHIAIEVKDIESAVKDANEKGIKIDASAIRGVDLMGGVKNVFFYGPDGERLEFFEYMKVI